MAPILRQATVPKTWSLGRRPLEWVVGVHCVQDTDGRGPDQAGLMTRIVPRVIIDVWQARPLLHFDPNILPIKVSREIEGFRMEQIQRLDGRISDRDFIQRMGPNGRSSAISNERAFPKRRQLFLDDNKLSHWKKPSKRMSFEERAAKALARKRLKLSQTEATKKPTDDQD